MSTSTDQHEPYTLSTVAVCCPKFSHYSYADVHVNLSSPILRHMTWLQDAQELQVWSVLRSPHMIESPICFM